MRKRGSGILLHISSLPSFYGVGDFGPSAYRFADFLSETGQSFWQILPLKPTSTARGNSPYSSYSAYAGNTLLISPELLVADGFLPKPDIGSPPAFPEGKVDYELVTGYKTELFRRVYDAFQKRGGEDPAFEQFCDRNNRWLDDYALFVALKEQFNGVVWSEWPRDIRDREEEAVRVLKKKLRSRMEREKLLQYIFYKQWFALKDYCTGKDIQIIGDIPIYADHDSADVWVNPQIFKLDQEKRPTVVAGVPPDYFSSTGQLWGSPVYRWEVLKDMHYSWWIELIEHNLKIFDIVRLDHFRGLVAYWEVPAGEITAVKGRWVEAPVRDFFDRLLKHFPYLPIIAEDLGVITPDVREVVNEYGFPGMKVLLFAFGGDVAANPYAPHNHVKNCVVYPGTHDNNTVRGWFGKEASPEEKKQLLAYLGREVTEDSVHWELLRMAMMSVADRAIISMQDILGLGEESRMNTPATTQGNWEWRLRSEQLTPDLVIKLSEITRIYGRA